MTATRSALIEIRRLLFFYARLSLFDERQPVKKYPASRRCAKRGKLMSKLYF